eukprot:Unigene13902_Nuclearia_a/m.42019 Unigene13902_Nuclearia_a/g.42019  ORF Unigene13902_Nuclearia_a/g.42019 Unigene13902_Nuclearia_a/m.42019 type:complete len:160 (+) Unigene13902_Nuclearia_a:27-506(+)
MALALVVVLRVPWPRAVVWTEQMDAQLWQCMGAAAPGRIGWEQVAASLNVPVDECVRRSALLLGRVQSGLAVHASSPPARPTSHETAAVSPALASPPPARPTSQPSLVQLHHESAVSPALVSPVSPVLPPSRGATDDDLTRSALVEAFLALNPKSDKDA